MRGRRLSVAGSWMQPALLWRTCSCIDGVPATEAALILVHRRLQNTTGCRLSGISSHCTEWVQSTALDCAAAAAHQSTGSNGLFAHTLYTASLAQLARLGQATQLILQRQIAMNCSVQHAALPIARLPSPHLLLSLLGCRCCRCRPLLALALGERRRPIPTRRNSNSNSGRLLGHDYISSESLALRHCS